MPIKVKELLNGGLNKPKKVKEHRVISFLRKHSGTAYKVGEIKKVTSLSHSRIREILRDAVKARKVKRKKGFYYFVRKSAQKKK